MALPKLSFVSGLGSVRAACKLNVVEALKKIFTFPAPFSVETVAEGSLTAV